jgi:uncharacterized membrane protein YoaK (UPF0700 family)
MSSKVFAHISDAGAVHMLAFVGGYIDAAGYLKIKGVFTSSITGNIVVACASLANMKGVICRSCVCIAFAVAGFVGAFFATNLRLAYQWSVRHLSIFLFSFEIAFFAIIWAVGNYLNDKIDGTDDIDYWPVVLVGCLMGAAMGFQNVAAKESIPNCPPTTVMTSTLINVAGGVSNLYVLTLASFGLIGLTPSSEKKTAAEWEALGKLRNESFFKLLPVIKPLIAFMVGAVIGAITMAAASFHCMAIPLFFLVVIAIEVIWKDISERNANPADAAAESINMSETRVVYSLYFQGTAVQLKKEVVSTKDSASNLTRALIEDDTGSGTGTGGNAGGDAGTTGRETATDAGNATAIRAANAV